MLNEVDLSHCASAQLAYDSVLADRIWDVAFVAQTYWIDLLHTARIYTTEDDAQPLTEYFTSPLALPAE